MKIDLNNCSLELDKDGIVELHIFPEKILNPDDIRELFDTIHTKMPEAKYLLVTAGNKASLNQEARDLVSSQDITNQIVADAVVTEHYMHQMSANFFVRHNQPHRPTKLFKTEEDARAWLITQ
jgi:hypothetical protein